MNYPRTISGIKQRIHTISWEMAELEGILETRITDLEYCKIRDKLNGLHNKSKRLKLSLVSLESKVAEARRIIQLYDSAQEV